MGHASSYSPRGGVEYVDGGKAILNGVGGLQVMRVPYLEGRVGRK